MKYYCRLVAEGESLEFSDTETFVINERLYDTLMANLIWCTK